MSKNLGKNLRKLRIFSFFTPGEIQKMSRSSQTNNNFFDQNKWCKSKKVSLLNGLRIAKVFYNKSISYLNGSQPIMIRVFASFIRRVGSLSQDFSFCSNLAEKYSIFQIWLPKIFWWPQSQYCEGQIGQKKYGL